MRSCVEAGGPHTSAGQGGHADGADGRGNSDHGHAGSQGCKEGWPAMKVPRRMWNGHGERMGVSKGNHVVRWTQMKGFNEASYCTRPAGQTSHQS